MPVFFRLNSELPAVPLVLLGALAAASGRLVLAATARRFRARFSAARRENLRAAEEVLAGLVLLLHFDGRARSGGAPPAPNKPVR